MLKFSVKTVLKKDAADALFVFFVLFLIFKIRTGLLVKKILGVNFLQTTTSLFHAILTKLFKEKYI